MTATRFVSARGVRGLQVGSRNLQLNHFEYRVENCDVNLAAMLRGYAVQQQLRLLATDPHNDQVLRRADALLRRRPFFSRAARHRVTQQTVTTTQDEPGDDVFETFLFVQDSSGVQISDDSRQENFFFSVIAPTIDASDLLRSDAELRAGLLEQVCASSTVAAGADFPYRLSAALEHAVLELPDLRTSGTLVNLRKHSRVDIRNEDGVSIGVRGRQRNNVSAEVAIPTKLLAEVREFADSLSPAAEAREAEPVGRAFARRIVDALDGAATTDEAYWSMISALDKAFPSMRATTKRLRWGNQTDLRRLRTYLETAPATDLSALQVALKALTTVNRAPLCARPAQSPDFLPAASGHAEVNLRSPSVDLADQPTTAMASNFSSAPDTAADRVPSPSKRRQQPTDTDRAYTHDDCADVTPETPKQSSPANAEAFTDNPEAAVAEHVPSAMTETIARESTRPARSETVAHSPRALLPTQAVTTPLNELPPPGPIDSQAASRPPDEPAPLWTFKPAPAIEPVPPRQTGPLPESANDMPSSADAPPPPTSRSEEATLPGPDEIVSLPGGMLHDWKPGSPAVRKTMAEEEEGTVEPLLLAPVRIDTTIDPDHLATIPELTIESEPTLSDEEIVVSIGRVDAGTESVQLSYPHRDDMDPFKVPDAVVESESPAQIDQMRWSPDSIGGIG